MIVVLVLILLVLVSAFTLMGIGAALHDWWSIIPPMPFWTALIVAVLIAVLVNTMTLLNAARNRR
ncbi:hypothetical protein [Nonomuraea sp. NPDC049400]|uniref:hypothetical protein n=1 Tax=Nonomuraea sp. NPDC049400 TaxID=3364352 RepID=UPI0037B5F968